MANDYIIDIQHLSKSFGGVKVLDDINFYIRRGEFITLLGPSGCGKTTLLRQIAGFIAPDEGKILLEGKDISGIPPYERPLNTVFQRYALFPHLDVYDNIAFGLKLQKLPADEIQKRVKRMLKMVSMTDYEDRSVDSLSGGQQQRVAIARTLAFNPDVILFDEPMSALDVDTRLSLRSEIKSLQKRFGTTMIYITHDQEEAFSMSDRVMVMDKGIIHQLDTPQNLIDNPADDYVRSFVIDNINIKIKSLIQFARPEQNI